MQVLRRQFGAIGRSYASHGGLMLERRYNSTPVPSLSRPPQRGAEPGKVSLTLHKIATYIYPTIIVVNCTTHNHCWPNKTNTNSSNAETWASVILTVFSTPTSFLQIADTFFSLPRTQANVSLQFVPNLLPKRAVTAL
jgi:hypothetical protein